MRNFWKRMDQFLLPIGTFRNLQGESTKPKMIPRLRFSVILFCQTELTFHNLEDSMTLECWLVRIVYHRVRISGPINVSQ